MSDETLSTRLSDALVCASALEKEIERMECRKCIDCLYKSKSVGRRGSDIWCAKFYSWHMPDHYCKEWVNVEAWDDDARQWKP